MDEKEINQMPKLQIYDTLKFALEDFCQSSFLAILQLIFQKDFKISLSNMSHNLLKHFQCLFVLIMRFGFSQTL